MLRGGRCLLPLVGESDASLSWWCLCTFCATAAAAAAGTAISGANAVAAVSAAPAASAVVPVRAATVAASAALPVAAVSAPAPEVLVAAASLSWRVGRGLTTSKPGTSSAIADSAVSSSLLPERHLRALSPRARALSRPSWKSS
ncbi:Uncharacterised protein [Mycobacteroides abscessus subsp. abscessus]|nr:Uncharacterised protein [Mycobacteroides abscessus subsp. abscessus]